MVITHGSVLATDGLILHACPDCGHPTPANEMAAYGRHEDCWVGTAPHGANHRVPMALRILLADPGRGWRRIVYTPPPGV